MCVDICFPTRYGNFTVSQCRLTWIVDRFDPAHLQHLLLCSLILNVVLWM